MRNRTCRIARQRRLLLEALEQRQVLADDLQAILDGSGNLTVTDIHASGQNNQLTLSRTGNDLVITDSVQTFAGAPATGSLSNSGRTLTIPLTTVTGSLTFNTAGGDDLLTVDLATGDAIPAGQLFFQGGNPTSGTGDRLIIAGGNQGAVTHHFTNAQEGSIVLANFGVVVYTGAESTTNTGTVTDLVFNLPTAGSGATWADDGTTGNGLSRLSSTGIGSATFANPTGSVTINAGHSNDSLAIFSLPDFTAGITAGSAGSPLRSVIWDGTVNLAAGKNLAVIASDSIRFPNPMSDVATAGSGTISLTTARNILLGSGSSLTAVNGDVNLTANMQATSTNANFKGIELAGGVVRTTGLGNVNLTGRGGAIVGTTNLHGVFLNGAGSLITTGGGNVQVTGFGGGQSIFIDGVNVAGGGVITAGGNGTVTVQGTGGPLGFGGNSGVHVTGVGSRITSTNGSVHVTGHGGSGDSANNFGVYVETQGEITSGSVTATTNVTGFGGGLAGGGSQNYGVSTSSDGRITSGGGNVLVTGTGGGAGESFSGFGVHLSGGGITTSSGGHVTIVANGGNSTGTGGSNGGVRMTNATSAPYITAAGNLSITGTAGGGPSAGANNGLTLINGTISAGGALTMQLTGGAGSGGDNNGLYMFGTGTLIAVGNGGANITAVAPAGSTPAIRLFSSGSIVTTGTGSITIAADRISLDSSVSLSAGANTLTLQPTTAGQTINLGADDTQTVLGLTDAELDRMQAGTLIIGGVNGSPITVSAAITRPALTNLQLRASNELVLSAGSLNTSGGTLLLSTSGGNLRPQTSGIDATAAGTTVAAGTTLQIAISGATLDTQYSQLNVVGTVNLTGTALSVTGAYVPTAADTFVIVNNDGTDPIIGTFSGLAENAAVTINGVQKRITYVGGTGNDVVLRAQNAAPTINSNGGGASGSTSVFTGNTAVTTVQATDTDLPGDTLTYSISGGADQAKFTIHPQSGALQFVDAPNFAVPTDVGSNNVYDVIVRVSDGVGGVDTQSLAVTVTNLLSVSGHRDLIYDPIRQQLLVTTSSGVVLRFNEATRSFLSPISVGGALNGGDITPDGNFLYVSDSTYTGGNTNVHKVDLNTLFVTDLPVPHESSDNGGWDLNIAANGKALLTMMFAGSGWVKVRDVDLATDVVTFNPRSEIRQSALISRSADYTRLFIVGTNSSGGDVHMYTASGGFAPDQSTNSTGTLSTTALSADGGLVSREFGSDIYIFDGNYKAVAQLKALSGGHAFHPTQNLFLAVDSVTDQVVALDTVTWQERYRLPVGQDVGNSTPMSAGMAAISANGAYFYLTTSTGIRVIPLPQATGIAASVNLTNYGTYVSSGSSASVTVTMRDPGGEVATNYTGTVQFSSSDIAAGLPTNYQFTAADAGTRTFNVTLNSNGNQTVTIRDTLQPSLTRTVTIEVHTAPASLIPVTAARDMVFDSLRNRLYITTSTGAVQRYDLNTESLLGSWPISQGLYGLDITPDNQSLYVQEGLRNAVQGMVRKIDLATGALSAVTYDLDGGEGSGWDLAIDSNGIAQLSSDYEGSGWSPLRLLNTTTDAVSNSSQGTVRMRTAITRNSARSRLFFQEANISSGPMFTYTTGGGYSPDYNLGGFQDSNVAAVSPNGNFIALKNAATLMVFTNTFSAVEQFTSMGGGVIFSPTEPLLFGIDHVTDELVAISTSTWTERYRRPLGFDAVGATPFSDGTLAFADNGRKLFMTTSTGIRVINIPESTGVADHYRLEPYSTYLAAGVSSSITVTVYDPTGVQVSNYAGTVTFSSTDVAAGLPANYTFGPSDFGSKTFNFTLNTAGNHTITVRDVTNAALTITTAPIAVHTGLSTILPITGARDLIFDSTRNVLYVTTSTGKIQRYSVTTDSLLPAWNVASSLNGGDINVANSAIYVQNAIRSATQGTIHKVNLNSGSVSDITYNLQSLEGGGWDLNIAANGLGFADSMFEGSGWVPLRVLNTANDTLTNSTHANVRQNTHIARSHDRTLLGFMESNTSGGPIFSYSSATGNFSSSLNTSRFLDNTFMAISSQGPLYAMAHNTGLLEIRNSTLAAEVGITGVYGGLAFKPGTNRLYLANNATGQIRVYDGDDNWATIQNITIGESLGIVAPMSNGSLAFSSDGTRLFLITPTGVRMYVTGDLTPPTLGGLPGNQSILEDASTAVLAFTIGDNVTPAANLVVTATSSNTAVIPNQNLVLGGSGSNRTIQVTPPPNSHGGPVTVTVTVTDAALNASQFTFTVNVASVNDSPGFLAGPSQVLNEDAGPQSITNWATGISTGAPNESSQTLTFQVTFNSNPGLFSTPPAISSTGTLTFTPAANANGAATLLLLLRDDGGTANGGSDATVTQSFTITVGAVNDPPTFVAGANQSMPLDAPAQSVTGWATAIAGGPPNETGQTVSFNISSNSNPSLFTVLPAVAADGTLTYTVAPGLSGSATIGVVAVDDGGMANGGVNTSAAQTFTITVNPPTMFQVTSFVRTATGGIFDFNRDLDQSQLNMYDIPGNLYGAADVVFQGAVTGSIRGSAIVDPNLRRLTFVATNGRLPADDYTVTLRSAANAFRDSTSQLLDGNADGTAGGNYVTTFTVAPDAPGTVTIELPNFARGPEQPVNVPANVTTGIPVSFSNGGGLLSASFQIRYNPALLNITGATLAPGLPAGTAAAFFAVSPGVGDILFTSQDPLPDGITRFVDLQANVPTSATYRAKQVLDIANIALSNNTPAIDDDAVHVNAYFGDATGNGTYSGQDASFAAQLAVGLGNGVQAFKMVDPVIIADVSGNGSFSATDTTRILQVSVAIAVPEIPRLPTPAPSLVIGGPDPKLSIPQNLAATTGDQLTIPVHIDSIVDHTGGGLESGELVIYFDATVFDLQRVSLGSLLTASPGWTFASRIDALAGRVFISFSGLTPLEGYFQGELVRLHAQVKPDAAPGPTAINLAATARDVAVTTQLNEGWLTLIPAPTDAANDDIDGQVTITAVQATTLGDRAQAQLDGNRLTITGTIGDDRFIVGELAPNLIGVRVNQAWLGSFPASATIVVIGLGGNDLLLSSDDLLNRAPPPASAGIERTLPSDAHELALLQFLQEMITDDQFDEVFQRPALRKFSSQIFGLKIANRGVVRSD